MYSQPENIMEKYDLTVEQINKGRGAYICVTEQGNKILVPYAGSKERADFLCRYLEYLQQQNMIVEQIIRTTEGDTLAQDELGDYYLLKDMCAGIECNPKKPEDLKAAVRLLAEYHQIARNCPLELPTFMQEGAQTFVGVYERRTRELVTVKNYIRSRKKKTEFEQLYQKAFSHFIDRANDVVQMFRQLPEDTDLLLCHGDFNHHNVHKIGPRWQLVNLEHLIYQPAMMDLANFIRKMMEKNNWQAQLGCDLIEEYRKIREISPEAERQLFAMLAFPEKFWKLANHYNHSRKSWLSERDIQKLRNVIAQEDTKSLFLEKAFDFHA